jgi:acyl-homoserine lactone acylase PvdQ
MGVSGNIFSKFYDNLLDSHNNGEYYPLNTGEDKFN